jgi:flagellar hook protein FlgE
MSNYNIGLSGLMSNSQAIDTISNNIANASTVGYKMGEFVFQDQFYKAINPLDPARAGMGTAKQNIRRIFTQGAVQSSVNTLDMAITGSTGMFRLATKLDSTVSETFYTRNGQFAVSKDVDASNPKRNYIVNENGMYLTGYVSADGVSLSDSWSNPLTMPPTTLDPKTTTEATLSVNLDARSSAFISSAPNFSPLEPSSFTSKITQTVYSKEDGGQAHTLTTYFRRIDDANVPVTFNRANGTFTYSPTSAADPQADTTTTQVVLNPEIGRTFKRLTPDGAATDVYTLTLNDGSIMQITSNFGNELNTYSDLIAAAAAAGSDLSFTAVVSQYEVYAALDDQLYNDATAVPAGEFFSDTVLTASVAGPPAVDGEIPLGTDATRRFTPIAVMRFAGGRNIDTAAVDPVSFESTFQTKVRLVGKVSTQGENTGTNRPDLAFDLDLSRINNFATPFSVVETSQNGNSVSLLNSVTIDNEGKIIGIYGDGRTYLAGQLALVNFSATNGLAPSGNNVFAATYLSGGEVGAGVTIGKPGENGLSNVRAGSVEASNVDLANELVKLLIQQRMYSANSQSIRAFDDTLTTTIRMTGG